MAAGVRVILEYIFEDLGDNMWRITGEFCVDVNFAGEVLVHFFGLNQSRYQWMIDLAKRTFF